MFLKLLKAFTERLLQHLYHTLTNKLLFTYNSKENQAQEVNKFVEGRKSTLCSSVAVEVAYRPRGLWPTVDAQPDAELTINYINFSLLS